MELAKIKSAIKEKRPHLTESSLKSYGYNILRVHRMVATTQFEKNVAEIEKAIQTQKIKPSIARSLINAVIVYEKTKGRETENLDELKAKYDTEFLDTVKLQKRSPKDEKRWVTQKDIDNVIKGVKAEVKRLNLWNRADLRPKEKQLLQIHFLVEFYRGNPIRNEIATTLVVPVGQYNQMKEKTENYLVLGHKTAELHFFEFKTSKSWARRKLLPRVFKLSKTQNNLLRRWLQHKPKGPNLFWRQNGTALKGAQGRDTLSRWLTGVFRRWTGKHVGSNMLRKVFVSELLQGAPSLTALLDAQQKLGHNLETMQTYRRD